MVLKPLESTPPRTVGSTSSITNLGNCTAEHFFAVLRGGRVVTKSRLKVLFFLSHVVLQQEYLGKATATHSRDGHNDCGTGCVCLRSVAYCDHSQPVLLSAVLFARRTNCGLFLGRKRGQQTRRHGSTEVKENNRTQLHFLPLHSLSEFFKAGVSVVRTLSTRVHLLSCVSGQTSFKDGAYHSAPAINTQ